MTEPAITLYASIMSRSFGAFWMLEELGVPYTLRLLDRRKGELQQPDYLRINAMGKVPALTDGATTVTENPAIALYLADRYSYGILAPKIDAPGRGAYLRWTVFSTAALEPALFVATPPQGPPGSWGHGWGDRDTALGALEQALSPGPWLLGDSFSAADVMIGWILEVAMFSKLVPERPALMGISRAPCRTASVQARDGFELATTPV